MNADILVLEDDVNVIRVLQNNISRVGYSMDFASTCEEVKRLLYDSVHNHSPYKIIILDSSIPSDSHLCESTNMLKEIDKDVKIVISSDIGVHPIIKNYKQYGYDAFLPKPYHVRDIRNLLESLLIHQAVM